MSNKHFSALLAALILGFFGWLFYDSRTSAEAIQADKVKRDLLGSSNPDSAAPIQYLYNFPEPVYHHDRNAADIETLARQSGSEEHYRVEGLTQAEFGIQTLYQFNSSRKLFGGTYTMWVENLRVDFSYTAVNVYVSNEYADGSCEFNATRDHENEHLTVHRRVYEKYQKAVQEAFAAAKDLPLADHPIQASSLAEGKDKIAAMLSAVTDPVFQDFRQELSDEQGKLDTKESYDRLKGQCSHW
jgi:hypothetical protein